VANEAQPTYTVDVQKTDEGAFVAIGGELDSVASPYLRERLVEAVENEPAMVTIDLSAVRFLDSVAVGLLVTTRRRVAHYGGSFSVKSGRPLARQILETTGLIEYLNVDSEGGGPS
jgi:anti-sigma B factor antagonist